jgi:2,4-diketo-3-deoxy-L-fuconate hydrolase
MTTGPDAPFALARYRDGEAVRLGLVAGDRIRPLDPGALGAPALNAFLADPDWDRLGALVDTEGPWMPLADVTLTAPV